MSGECDDPKCEICRELYGPHLDTAADDGKALVSPRGMKGGEMDGAMDPKKCEPNLGCATTVELLAELTARAIMGGYGSYRTLGIDN